MKLFFNYDISPQCSYIFEIEQLKYTLLTVHAILSMPTCSLEWKSIFYSTGPLFNHHYH